MKKNLPVSGQEITLQEDSVLISTTDLKGAITHANQEFISTSGFTEDELLNNNHNVVRHPDMPSAIFEDLWQTLNDNNPWIGIVNNRCKNGDNYWVDAFVTPIIENNEVIGHHSVRVKSSRENIERAKKLYAKINAGKLRDRDLGSPGYANKLFLSMSIAILTTWSIAISLLELPITASILSLGTGLIVSFILSQSLSKPLRKAAAESKSIINNPVARYVYSGRTDETGQLQVTQQMLQAKLRTVIGRVEEAAADLSLAALETTATAEQTKMGITQQKSETEQLASAITEMAATVQSVARNTVDAADSTNKADTETKNIKLIMTQTIGSICNLEDGITEATGTVKQLETQSHTIGKVLDVIRAIAEQTNLLALNAAIEAARAGESGRGFTVVADEVRTLAVRTSDATQEIQSMIEGLQNGTQNAVASMSNAGACAEQCVEHITATAESIATITGSVSEINDMNTQIATAAEEQSVVAEEISRNIHVIDDVSNLTTLTAEQTASASERLLEMAKILQTTVNQCKL